MALRPQTVLDTPWFQIATIDPGDEPGGSTEPYYVFLRSHGVIAVVLDEAGRLVLIDQYRPPLGRTTLETPAGSIEPGETPVEAADRELAEECGLAAGGWTEIGSFWLAPEYSTEFVHVLAGSCSGVRLAEHDADEDITVVRLPPERALAALEDAGSVAALGLWMRQSA